MGFVDDSLSDEIEDFLAGKPVSPNRGWMRLKVTFRAFFFLGDMADGKSDTVIVAIGTVFMVIGRGGVVCLAVDE